MIELNKREKRLLQILGIIIALFLVYLIITRIINCKQNINNKFESNIEKLNKLDKIYEQFRDVRQKITKYKSQLRGGGKGITTLIEENAKTCNIISNKVYTRDNPSRMQGNYQKISTDVKFEGVDITSILNFIYKMENSGRLIKVSYLRINETLKGRNTYDVTIKFDSLTSE